MKETWRSVACAALAVMLLWAGRAWAQESPVEAKDKKPEHEPLVISNGFDRANLPPRMYRGGPWFGWATGGF
jgi:hypothetical protein